MRLWALEATNKASIRQRDLPAHVVVYFVIALALYMQSSYREVLRCLLEGVQWLLDPSTAMKVAGKSGISQARSQAAASGRRVLLDFVADWCEDCREVVRLSHLEPARSVIEERYVVVYVEVGRFNRHRDLIERYGVRRIATLVVPDPDSDIAVAQTTLEPITGGGRGLSPQGLADWLRQPSTR